MSPKASPVVPASAPSPQPSPAADRASNPLAGCLLRMAWMAGGYATLFFVLVEILVSRRQRLSLLDGVYGAVVLATVAARYLDIRFCAGTTADGAPATMAHWRRYLAITAGVAVALWGAVHGVIRLLG